MSEPALQAVRRWVESVVIGLNLCPFARQELVNDRVRFALTDATTEQGLVLALQAELERLNETPGVETTLLVHPNVLQDFGDYNQFLDTADRVLVEMELEGVVQIASFHPGYQFAGTASDDVENYTNRSPYPILHLLREASLEKAIAAHPDVDGIPRQNIERMKQLGVAHLTGLLAACLDDDGRPPP